MPRISYSMSPLFRWLLLIVSAFGMFGVGFVGTSLLRSGSEARFDLGPGSTSVTAPAPTDKFLWLVYVGNPDCGWSTQPATREAVRAIITRTKKEAERLNVGFIATGLVTTTAFRRALDHLDGLGEFDEVSMGEHPTNSVTLDYFWGQGVAPSTPQVVLFERAVDIASQDSFPSPFTNSDVRRLARASGISALTAWAESGRLTPPASADLSPLTSTP